MRFMRNTALFLLAVAFAFGGGTAWGANASVDIAQSSGSGSSFMGKTSGSAASGYSAKVYHYTGMTGSLLVSMDISADINPGTNTRVFLKNGGVKASADIASFITSTSFDVPLVFTSLPSGTVNYAVEVSGDTTSADVGSLNLTFVPVTATLSTGSPTLMTFVKGIVDTAGYTVSVDTTPAASTDIALYQGASLISTGSDVWGSTNVIATTSVTTLSSVTLNAASAPLISKDSTLLKIKAGKFIVKSDGNALVAGTTSASVDIAPTFNAQIIASGDYKITLSSSSLTVKPSVSASASLDVTDSFGIAPVLTVSDSVTATSSALNSVTWNGLLINVSVAGKISVTQTPTANGTHSFRVFGKPGSSIYSGLSAYADFSLTVSDNTLRLTPSTVSGDVTRTFADTVTAVVSEDTSKAFAALTLSEGSRNNVVSMDVLGLLVSADSANKKIVITGRPAADSAGKSAYVTVKGTTVSSTTSNDVSATLTIKINSNATAPYSLTLSPSTLTPTVGAYDTKNVAVSVSPTTPLSGLKVSGDTTVVWNGLTLSTTADYKTISVTGTPLAALTRTFAVSATAAAGTVSPRTLTIAVGGPSVINVDPGAILLNDGNGSFYYYDNGTTTNFNVGQSYTVSFQARAILNPLEIYLQRPGQVGWTLLRKDIDYTVQATMSTMTIAVRIVPIQTGNHNLRFDYTYNSTASGGTQANALVPGSQTVSLRATIGEYPPNGGNSGCDAAGLGIAALGLCLYSLRRKN